MNPEILLEELGGEVLVYDPGSRVAHVLNAAACGVLMLCNGARSVGELVSDVAALTGALPVEVQDAVYAILEQLGSQGLVAMKVALSAV